MHAREVSMPHLKYLIDVLSFKEEFPPTIPVPELLITFAEWLGKSNVYVGAMKLYSRRLDDLSASGLGDLYKSFAPFIRTSCGSVVAFWLPDGIPLKSPPIALIGSEGDNMLLADSLENFLWRLADGKTGDHDLDIRDETCGDGGPELSKWLTSQDIEQPVQHSWPDFASWWDKRQEAYEDWCDSDPLHLAIAERLRRIWAFSPNAERWQTHLFDAVIVGTRFEMWQRRHGPQLIDSIACSDLEPLLREDRERRARQFPERGLWFQSSIRVGATGGARLCSDFICKPNVGDAMIHVSLQDYRTDLDAFPRSRYWTPTWLKS